MNAKKCKALRRMARIATVGKPVHQLIHEPGTERVSRVYIQICGVVKGTVKNAKGQFIDIVKIVPKMIERQTFSVVNHPHSFRGFYRDLKAGRVFLPDHPAAG